MLHDLSDEVQHKLFLAAVITKNSQVIYRLKQLQKKKSIVKEVQVIDCKTCSHKLHGWSHCLKPLTAAAICAATTEAWK